MRSLVLNIIILVKNVPVSVEIMSSTLSSVTHCNHLISCSLVSVSVVFHPFFSLLLTVLFSLGFLT